MQLNDETLRDGLQSPSVRAPTIEQKLRILHLLDRSGIDTADIGLPGAGPHVVKDASASRLKSSSAGSSCRPTAPRGRYRRNPADCRHRPAHGLPIECCCFIGSSPIRRYAEDWTVDYLQRCTEEAVGFAVRQGLTVMYVTEDTTRVRSRHAAPAVLDGHSCRRLAHLYCRHGRPRDAGRRTGGRPLRENHCRGEGGGVGIDWHGHRDRDMGTINSIAAIEAGATRVHGTMLGLGERVGNTPMDLLMVNLVLMGWIERDLTHLNDLVHTGVRGDGRADSRQLSGVRPRRLPHGHRRPRRGGGQGVPQERPGSRRHGVSGVPARLVGRSQQIEIGPMSGKSNVVFWLEHRGIRRR